MQRLIKTDVHEAAMVTKFMRLFILVSEVIKYRIKRHGAVIKDLCDA